MKKIIAYIFFIIAFCFMLSAFLGTFVLRHETIFCHIICCLVHHAYQRGGSKRALLHGQTGKH